MATQAKFDRRHTLAEAQLSTADQNTIYFTTDTHKVVMKGEIYGTTYTLSTATSSVLGGAKLGSDMVQTVGAGTPTSVADRTYPVQVNQSEQMVINVPWEDSLPVWDNELDANEIWYTSSDGNKVDPHRTSALPKIDTNTYYTYDGKGVIKCASNITSIGEFAFAACNSLTSIILPDSVTEIDHYAFSNCNSLTSIKIPDRVAFIGDYAFYDCSSLVSIIIPDMVTSIGNYVFLRCNSLTSVTIPNNVTIIRDLAFSDCTSLTSITIPDSVRSIGAKAFYNCTSLTSATIPNRVTSIGYAAFQGCAGLTSVTIGGSVEIIEDSAFWNCTGLTSIICKTPTPPTIQSSTWSNVNRSIPVYVPVDSVSLYQQAQYWSEFTNIQAIQ